METDRKKITEENLIRCGREEFLEKGYAGANLRNICKRAGVTTGLFLLPG
jgi:AcrR family transcriptional regulator